MLSAQTPSALDTTTANLAAFLSKNPDLSLADVAYTLQVGRKAFRHRRILVCNSHEDAISQLQRKASGRVRSAAHDTAEKPIVFMFPGEGAQYINMGQRLYQTDPSYRENVDRCWKIVADRLPELVAELSEQDRLARSQKIHRADLSLLSLFIVEYSLAKLLMAWGFKPEAVVGYGLGEWVAATIAGVVSVEDALTIVGKVGGLIQSLPAGEMLAVDLSEQEVRTHLGDQLSLAAITGPQQCIVSGPSAAINSLMNTLRASQVTYRRQFSTRAFHSSMIDAILPEVRQLVAKASFNQPEILFLSLRTGKPMTDQAADPATWVDQWRDPVLFAAGMTELFQEPDRIFIEVGPERILTTLANRLPARQVSHLVLPTMRHPLESIGGIQILLTSIGRLWLQGVDVDWEAYSADWVRGRVSLPPSPFEKSRHWIDAPKVRWRSRTILEIASDEDSQDVMSAEEGADARNHLSTSFVAPRDELETEISQMWAKGLGIDRVGIQDNFFEMGGDSLLAIGLLSTLGKRFGVPLPSHAMVQHQSVASMAELIRQSAANLGEAESDSALVEIQRGQPQFPPLYMVHPIGGDIYFYRDLAKRLSTSQPVYAFQARSLSGDVPPFDDIQKQASAYLEDLLEKQAHGPYLLGGSSYGGLVAYVQPIKRGLACATRVKGDRNRELEIVVIKTNCGH